MQTTEQNGYLYTNSEWFLAKITAVCPPVDANSNYTCSWQQYSFTPNMQLINQDENLELQYGDCIEETNVAVPINESDPSDLVGTIVLMRQRGATDTVKNIFEFVSMGGGGGEPSVPACFVVKSVQCTNNILQVVSSNAGGCLSCTGGLATYEYNQPPLTPLEIPTDTAYLLPNYWTLMFGNLDEVGLQFSGNALENVSGSTLTLRVTLQVYFTPQGPGATQSRWAFVARNGDTSDLPVASFQSSNQTFSAVVATNVFQLANGDTIQAGVFQDGGSGYFVGGDERVLTTLTVEKLCL